MHTRDDGDARERPRRDEPERDERLDTHRRRRPAERDRDPDRPRRRRSEDDEERAPRASTKRLPALEAARAGLRQLAVMTGREPEGVVSLVPDQDGWRVGIEIVEDHRIPSSTDVLGLYEATVDDDGQLTGYTRKRRYPRGKGDAGEMSG